MSFIETETGPEISEPCTLLDLRKFIAACAAHDVALNPQVTADEMAKARQIADTLLEELKATPGPGGWHPTVWELRRLTSFLEQVNPKDNENLVAISLPMMTQLPDELLDGIEIHPKDGTFRMTGKIKVFIEDQ